MIYIMKMDQAITTIKYKDIHSSIVMQIGMYQALELLCTRKFFLIFFYKHLYIIEYYFCFIKGKND